MVNVAILGYGTIGSGVYKVINDNNSHVSRRAGDDIRVKYVLDLRDFPGDPVEDILVHDFDVILNDDEVSVVVETMGGVEPAHTFAMQCLLAGKSVCTSNKEVVAKWGFELLQIARENNCNFFFEASVGGGIPIIRPLIGCITADHIKSISGILNGTTNYILTKMSEEGLAFDDVLADAQRKGYAERNPEADIEGYDACRKIAILASLAYERQVNFEDIYTEGISKITGVDFWYANQLYASIKLLGLAKRQNGTVYAMVAPFIVKQDNPLFGVKDVFNAILLDGDMLGEVMFYGQGAGSLPTASAVVADVISAVKNKGRNIPILWRPEKRELGSVDAFETSYLVRVAGLKAADENSDADIKKEVNAAFGEVEFLSGQNGEVAFVTKPMSGADFEKAAENFEVVNRIRIADM
jgi:Homoserine dehydrogenase